MGIFGRVKEMAAADIHHMLDRMEDPIPMAKQYIRQVEEQLDHTRQALIQQLAAEQNYDVMIARAKEMVGKRLRQAELAVERDEEPIAEIAVQDKLYHERLIQEYEGQREVIRQQADLLRKQMVQLTDMHQDLQNRLFFLVSRIHAAQSMKSASSTLTNLDTDRVTRSFTRVEDKLRYLETGINAREYGSAASDTAGKLDVFETQEAIKAELYRIKEAKGKE
ncbi:PspA/IM30 family protein [Paenibacillus sp. N3/727]|uniref:PspA/IM30 family protein n=1 Tax=Paenibacillus sp. N3/727 TaxID=2925845 RepID=UPI001F53CC71|nr:PspA/IM30 family protein [Paenibacillus sp. N3/727]UNK19153.1 PspA/IM30 family protein [Paenibacillus sp. N3/727]